VIFGYSWSTVYFIAGTLVAACANLAPSWKNHPAKRLALVVTVMQSACIAYAVWGLYHKDRLLMRGPRDYHFENHGLALSLVTFFAAVVLCVRSRKVVSLLACASVTWLLGVWVLAEFPQY
jgi:hypothetical protein